MNIILLAFLAVWNLANGADIIEETYKKVSTQDSIEKATKWLLSKRQDNWGWESDTADVIIALQLTNFSWASKENLESQLSIKQLEMDTALTLWSRHHDSPVRPGRLAKMINAMVAVCREPKSFYGHDLVAILEHLDTSHPFEYSYVMLTMCTSGVHIRKKQVRRLYSFVETEELHNHDTLAMTVLAMTCVVREHHNRNLVSYLRKPIKRLKKLQHEDGSFGNIHTSALATQALLSAAEDHPDWNLTKALDYFLKEQQPDGSFGNLLATLTVLPVLAGHSYSHLLNATCREEEQPPLLAENVVVTAEAGHTILQAKPGIGGVSVPIVPSASPEPKLVTVRYSLWIGNNITENHTLPITVAANTSFYEIMKVAAEENEKFEFSASLWPNGHYVHTLAGLKEDRSENHYWLLCLNNNGIDKTVFVDTGVDDYYPQDNDNIVFWFKKI